MLLGAIERACERERGRRVIRCSTGACGHDCRGDAVRHADERHDVAPVVLKDRSDECRVPRAEVAKVVIRDELTGDVLDAPVVEDGLLDLAQGHRAEAATPQAAGGVQQIEMRRVDRDLRAQGHHEAGAEQRKVEALAVVRGARAEPTQLPLQHPDERPLGTQVVQEMLPEDELAILDVRGPEQEHICAGAARQAGGLGVQEEDVLPAARGVAAKAEVHEDAWIGRAVTDDLET